MKQIGRKYNIIPFLMIMVFSSAMMACVANHMTQALISTPAPSTHAIAHIDTSLGYDVEWIGWSTWSPDGTRLAAVDFPLVHVFNTATWEIELTISDASVSKIIWNPKGTQLAGVSGGDKESLYIWDATTGNLIKQLTRPYDGPPSNMVTIFRLAWSPDGTRIASDSWNGDVLVWDLTQNEAYTLGRHAPNGVGEVDWSPDSSQIVSGGGDGTIRTWAVANTENILTVEGGGIVDWHPSANKIVGTQSDHSVIVWDATSGQELLVLNHPSTTPAVRWNFDGSLIATGDLAGIIRIWDGETGTLITTIDKHTDLITSLSWHPHQNLLAGTSYTGDLQVWQINP